VKIISIDPGGVTGWATFEFDIVNNKPVLHEKMKEHFTSAGQIRKENHHELLWRFLDRKQPDIVVCERYEKRNNDFSLLISVEYIGVVKAWCQTNEKTLVMQGAGEALFFMTKDKMYVLDLTLEPYTRWKDANAARKHLVFFLINWKYQSIRNRILWQLKPIG
jgi:hypothetical protein